MHEIRPVGSIEVGYALHDDHADQAVYALARQVANGQEQAKKLAYAPIGVFDSGAGGLTILSALRAQLPYERYIYLGDTANCPYGTRSEEEITDLTIRACGFLVEQGVKLIVVACNTASQAALSALRARYTLPFVGVVPAVKPAAQLTRVGRIGVAATNQAAQADYLRSLIENFAAHVQVYAAGCSELVTLVERGELAGPIVDETLRHSLGPLIEHDVDVIVLGCTHFPALRPAIEGVVGPGVQVIDSSAAIVRRTRSLLQEQEMLHPAQEYVGEVQIWCSGDAEGFSRVASAVLGNAVVARQATLPLRERW
jgi:glutamate racemase